jgi:hypothetical protein
MLFLPRWNRGSSHPSRIAVATRPFIHPPNLRETHYRKATRKKRIIMSLRTMSDCGWIFCE